MKRKGFYIDSKGYWQHTSGPMRKQREHRTKIEAKLGRKLRKDEDVHHRNGNKLDNRLRNLKVLGHAQHSFITAKQHWYVTKMLAEREKRQWDEWRENEAR